MPLLPEVEHAVLDAVRRDRERSRRSRWTRLRAMPVRMRVPVIGLAVVLGTTTIALAAGGVILTGSPVATHAGKPTVGYGVPAPGRSRLLPLRAADPGGGLPWGMRIVNTTRGYICVQIGRVDHGRLGELGIDGAFHDDGRFHPLPVDALPETVSRAESFDIDCESGSHTPFAGEIDGIEASAASNPQSPAGGSLARRREISYGLLGPHAVKIAYRSGKHTRTREVLRGLGAYLIVDRASRRPGLGGIGDTLDAPGDPVSPNGVLTAITYRFASKTCVDTGHGPILHRCGLPEGPPPKPAPLPVVHVALRVHLRVRHRTVVSAQISFRAPYPVRSAQKGYVVESNGCDDRGDSAAASRRDLAKGAVVRFNVGSMLSDACGRSMKFTVIFTRMLDDTPVLTRLGSVTVHIPSGTHPIPPQRVPVPRSVRERLRKAKAKREPARRPIVH